MKRILLLSMVVLAASACEIIVVEPSYDFRDDVVGIWEMDEYSETYNLNAFYDIRITKNFSTPDEVFIHNFYDVDISVIGFVDGSKLVIPLQIVNGYEIEGVGTFRGDRITFTYSVFDDLNGGWTDYCTAIAW